MNVRKATIQDLIPVLNMQVSLREEVFGLKEYNENAIFLNLVGHLFNENSVLIVAEEGCLVTSFMLGWIQMVYLACEHQPRVQLHAPFQTLS